MEAVGKLWSEYRARTPQRLKVLVQLPRMILLFFFPGHLFSFLVQFLAMVVDIFDKSVVCLHTRQFRISAQCCIFDYLTVGIEIPFPILISAWIGLFAGSIV